jgi:hypothetical protein
MFCLPSIATVCIIRRLVCVDPPPVLPSRHHSNSPFLTPVGFRHLRVAVSVVAVSVISLKTLANAPPPIPESQSRFDPPVARTPGADLSLQIDRTSSSSPWVSPTSRLLPVSAPKSHARRDEIAWDGASALVSTRISPQRQVRLWHASPPPTPVSAHLKTLATVPPPLPESQSRFDPPGGEDTRRRFVPTDRRAGQIQIGVRGPLGSPRQVPSRRSGAMVGGRRRLHRRAPIIDSFGPFQVCIEEPGCPAAGVAIVAPRRSEPSPKIAAPPYSALRCLCNANGARAPAIPPTTTTEPHPRSTPAAPSSPSISAPPFVLEGRPIRVGTNPRSKSMCIRRGSRAALLPFHPLCPLPLSAIHFHRRCPLLAPSIV